MRRTRRNLRDVNGILLLDKAPGATSNRALQDARICLEARKAGHTGSLDPLASGLLPLCFGEATKFSQFLLDADKTYWTVLRLGQETSTYDAQGTILDTRPVTADRAQIEAALARFTGEIDQIPPAYSAIKQGGQPLYKLARAGIEVNPAPRRVLIHRIRLLGWQDDRLELELTCSKGTYVRSLAHDLGQVLECGAHVEQLRRLALGVFRVEEAVNMERLRALSGPEERATLLLPGDRAVVRLPAISLSANAAYYLCQGQAVFAAQGHSPGPVRLYEADGRFLGLGQVLDDGRVAPRRLIRSPERTDNTKESG
ncbi:MAG: tRNA pseudouridine(55) synthase TruB [Acidiferrobacterales bacterium]